MGEFDHLVNLMTGETLFHRNGRFWNDPFTGLTGSPWR